jgi:hypothetical protein
MLLLLTDRTKFKVLKVHSNKFHIIPLSNRKDKLVHYYMIYAQYIKRNANMPYDVIYDIIKSNDVTQTTFMLNVVQHFSMLEWK